MLSEIIKNIESATEVWQLKKGNEIDFSCNECFYLTIIQKFKFSNLKTEYFDYIEQQLKQYPFNTDIILKKYDSSNEIEITLNTKRNHPYSFFSMEINKLKENLTLVSMTNLYYYPFLSAYIEAQYDKNSIYLKCNAKITSSQYYFKTTDMNEFNKEMINYILSDSYIVKSFDFSLTKSEFSFNAVYIKLNSMASILTPLPVLLKKYLILSKESIDYHVDYKDSLLLYEEKYYQYSRIEP